jgi:cell wall-associated NlpC family hydrolase
MELGRPLRLRSPLTLDAARPSADRLVAMGTRLMVVTAVFALSGCASSGAVPRPFPTPDDRAAPVADEGRDTATARTLDGYAVSSTALGLRGIQYREGGTDPTGFDCSGFVQYVFAQHGMHMPRDVRSQFTAGEAVERPRLTPGDLVFFTTTAPGATHVGIAVGGDGFVHAPSTRGVVRVERLSASYWSSRFVGARRVN